MGLFDNIGAPLAQNTQQSSGNKTVDVVFAKLPDNFAVEASKSTPFNT